MMASCKVLVGNSSSGLREGAWIGTPAVNVGGRQRAREHGTNVADVTGPAWMVDTGALSLAIQATIESQIDHGPYEPSLLYGDGTAGEKVADVILGTWTTEARRLSAQIRERL